MSQTKAQLLNPSGNVDFSGQLTGVGATFTANIAAVDGVFSGNVSVAGTLTKQDVTNVDSVGIITARSGVNVTSGGIDVAGGIDVTSGIVFIGQGGSGANNAELKLQAGAGTGNDIIAFLNQAGATKGNITYDTDNNFAVFNVNSAERLRITSGGQVAIGTATAETGYILTMAGDLSLGEKNGASNTYIDQKQDGDLHIINSGRTAQGGSGSPGAGGVGINRFNNISGGTTLFRDFAVYNGKDSKVLVVDGSSGNVGVGSDLPQAKLDVNGSFINSRNVNSTGDAGIQVANGHRLGFDQSGTRSWTVKATGGNLEIGSGDGNGSFKVATNGGISDSKGNLRSIPATWHNAATYTLVASDAGKFVSEAYSGGNITVPASIFSTGDAITIMNHTGGIQTITQGSGVTMYNAADASTGNRALAARGICTLLYREHNVVYISGSGLS